MNKAILTALAGLALSLPALAAPVPHPVVAPHEAMLNIAPYGPSRISTITHCLSEVGVTNHEDVITDTQVEVFYHCMKDHT
jgi:hypothetical protein